MSNLSVEQLKTLSKLAGDIRGRYETAVALANSAKDKAREAIAEAILCGKALNDAKAMVGHGEWLHWLAEHCKDICEKTAQNYMRLAKTKHVADLTDLPSLRQAYKAVGIGDLNTSNNATCVDHTTRSYSSDGQENKCYALNVTANKVVSVRCPQCNCEFEVSKA